MKKWIAFCLALMLMLTACQSTQEPAQTTATPTQATTQAPTETTQAPTEATTQATEAPTEATTEAAQAPTEVTQTAESSITPILYEVTDGQGNTIWLFGSIHVGREDFYPLPAYVQQVFEQADALAVEFDIRAFQEDMSAQIQALKSLLYTDGTTIKDHISEDLYNRAVAILKESGQYVSMLDYYMPMMWSSFIDLAYMDESAAELGIDINLINMAYQIQKPVLSIESAEAQYSMMAGFSPQLQQMLLESSVMGYEDGSAQLQTQYLLDAWAQGDLEVFQSLLASPPETAFASREEAELYAQYEDGMISQRDNLMTQYCKDALAEGKRIFVCVGAAHILGPDTGMVRQLEEAGYTVTRILGE